MFFNRKTDETELLEVLGNYCGVGLWDSIMVEEDVLHPQSRWMFTNEFRRLLGCHDQTDFPNVAGSMFDRFHPDDLKGAFHIFQTAMADRKRRAPYVMDYRLKMPDGTFRWFRATGGFVRNAKGVAIRACGSLTDIHEVTLAGQQSQERARRVGDLAAQFEREMSAMTAKVMASAGAMEDTAGGLAQTAEDVSSKSGEVTVAASSASDNVSAVALTTQQLGHAIVEISHQIECSAGLSRQAVIKAQSSSHIFAELSEIAAGIAAIVGSISGLAGQTNLLALNATIEAARAGEAGKGFSVVASEVKGLAEQTALATAEISRKMTAIQSATGGAVAAIGEISDIIRAIDQSTTSIAAAVEEQSAATRTISGAVAVASDDAISVTSSIGSVAIAAGKTESAAMAVREASTQMTYQARQLSQQVKSFLEQVQSEL